jgi:WD40 repeat protein
MSRLHFPAVLLAALVCIAGEAPAQTQPKPRVDAFGDPLPDGAVGRLGGTRFRHGGRKLLGYSVDGKFLVFDGRGALALMDLESGKITKVARYQDEAKLSSGLRFREFTGPVLSGDGKVLVYADDGDQAFVVVDAVAVKETKRIKRETLINQQVQVDRIGYQLSHDGKVLVIFPSDFGNSTLAWADTTTGQKLGSADGPQGARWRWAQVSHDGKQIVALSDGGQPPGKLHVFETVGGKTVRALAVDRSFDFYFLLRDDNKTLVGWSAGNNGGPNQGDRALYDYSDDKQLKEVRKFTGNVGGDPNRGFGTAAALSPDGKDLFIRSGTHVTHFKVEDGKQVQALEVGQADEDRFSGRPSSHPPILSRDGKQVAVTNSKTVAVYSVAGGTSLTPATSGGAVFLVRFAPDGKTIITSTQTHNNWIWDVKEAKPVRKLDAAPNTGGGGFGGGIFTSLFGELALSSDGKYLALGTEGRGVNVWDTTTGKHLHQLGGQGMDFGGGDRAPSGFAFAPQGHLLATAGGDGMIRLWDAVSGKELRSWAWHKNLGKNDGRNESAMLALAFTRDGKTLAGAGFTSLGDRDAGTLLVLWEAATGRERLRLRTTFDLGGARDDFAIIVLVLDQFAMSMKFSPDGKTLFMGTFTNLHLIDTVKGKDIRTFSSRLCLARSATYSKDGKYLFLGRYDGGIRVLEAATGNVIREVPGHDEPVFTLSLSPDGKTLASGSADATVLLWDVAEITRPVSVTPAKLTAADLDGLWQDLADPNGERAYAAINRLAASPAEAAAFLKGKLKPVPPIDPAVLERLFTDLNSVKFKERDRAMAELDKLGDLALGELQKRLAANPTLEMRQRMEKLLGKLLGPVTSPEMLRAFGAIEALEKMGTPDALAVLESIAQGAPGHRITEDGRAAAKRVKGT